AIKMAWDIGESIADQLYPPPLLPPPSGGGQAITIPPGPPPISIVPPIPLLPPYPLNPPNPTQCQASGKKNCLQVWEDTYNTCLRNGGADARCAYTALLMYRQCLGLPAVPGDN